MIYKRTEEWKSSPRAKAGPDQQPEIFAKIGKDGSNSIGLEECQAQARK